MELKINRDSCILCGRCVAVCPAYIFNESSDAISISNAENCIKCGHCVAACPQSAVLHSLFPTEKVHSIDYTNIPSAEQVMLLCKKRRSNRAFTKEMVKAEYIDMILEAAHVAPTASNLQQVEFTVVTTAADMQFIRDYTIGVFAGIVKKLMNPILKPIIKMVKPELYKHVPSFLRLIGSKDRGVDLVLRNATAVIFIHTPESSRFGSQDANLAYQNGSLMAEALGVSQFYTGFVCSAISQDKENKLARKFAINGTIHAGMAIGMASFDMPNYVDRKDLKVTKL